MENGVSMYTAVSAAVSAQAVDIARVQERQADHERRIVKLEAVVWKVLLAALTGAVGGSAAAVAVARLLVP